MIISIFPTEEEAQTIAKMLLNNRLVACANIIPKMKSLYWWKNKIQEDEEVFMMLKTKPELELEVINKIKENHSYEIPAIFAISSTEIINEEYLNWLIEETR